MARRSPGGTALTAMRRPLALDDGRRRRRVRIARIFVSDRFRIQKHGKESPGPERDSAECLAGQQPERYFIGLEDRSWLGDIRQRMHALLVTRCEFSSCACPPGEERRNFQIVHSEPFEEPFGSRLVARMTARGAMASQEMLYPVERPCRYPVLGFIVERIIAPLHTHHPQMALYGVKSKRLWAFAGRI